MSTAISPLQKILASPERKQNPAPVQPQLPPAEICPTCHGGLFWLDAYDGLHCGFCEAPPRPSFVREVLLLVRRMWLPNYVHPIGDPDNDKFDGIKWEWRTLKELRRATQQAVERDDDEDSHNKPTEFTERLERKPDGLASIVTFERGYRGGPQAGEGFDAWWSRQRVWK